MTKEKHTHLQEVGQTKQHDRPVDRVLIHGKTDDGEGLKVLRQRGKRLEIGVAKPLAQGKPIAGEVVRLKPHKDFPLLCDVEVAFAPDPGENAAPRKGPSRVSSARYRANWTSIWGKSKKTQAPN